MPRGAGAQHDTQLRMLGDAAVRVLARDGLPGLTFRTVAAEAGVSPGRVQHYARTSKGLTALTFRRVQELATERVRESLEALPSRSPAQVVGATLRALIPQDETDRTMLRVAAAVELHALTEPTLADELRDGRVVLIGFLADQIRLLSPMSTAAGTSSPGGVATTLLATAEGLSTLALAGAVDGAEARHMLDAVVRTAVGDVTDAG